VICSIDKSGKFATVSPASSKVLGYSPDELLGKHYIDLAVAEDAARVLASMDALLAAEAQEPFETKIKRKDGAIIDILFSAYWSNQEKTYFCVLHDITERKDAERMKQEVLAMVSHDLRTPLTAIRHLLEMLDMGTGGELPEGARKLVSRADAASKRMLTLVNDLLEIEKIRAGMMELNRAEIPVANLFEACMPIIAPLAEEKSVKLNIIDTDIDVFADPNRIIQVIVNIVSNAIKFSPQRGTVTVCARSRDNAVQIEVKDQGPGIPVHMRESIFSRFQQLQQGDDFNKGGTGLGLAICKAIVQLHGGEIWVECPKDEGGSTFIFTISGAVEPSA
jgi:PAS domain S-box-containing protein